MNSEVFEEEKVATKNFEKRRSNINMGMKEVIGLYSNFINIAGSSIRSIDSLKLDPDSSVSNVELLQRIVDENE